MTDQERAIERAQRETLEVEMERKKQDITRLRDVQSKLNRALSPLDRLFNETEKKRIKERIESLVDNVGATIEREVSEVRTATLSARERASSREMLKLPHRTLSGASVDHLTVEELQALDNESEAPADEEVPEITPELKPENR